MSIYPFVLDGYCLEDDAAIGLGGAWSKAGIGRLSLAVSHCHDPTLVKAQLVDEELSYSESSLVGLHLIGTRGAFVVGIPLDHQHGKSGISEGFGHVPEPVSSLGFKLKRAWTAIGVSEEVDVIDGDVGDHQWATSDVDPLDDGKISGHDLWKLWKQGLDNVGPLFFDASDSVPSLDFDDFELAHLDPERIIRGSLGAAVLVDGGGAVDLE